MPTLAAQHQGQSSANITLSGLVTAITPVLMSQTHANLPHALHLVPEDDCIQEMYGHFQVILPKFQTEEQPKWNILDSNLLILAY